MVTADGDLGLREAVGLYMRSSSAGNDMRFLPEQPEQPEEIGVIRQKTAESSG